MGIQLYVATLPGHLLIPVLRNVVNSINLDLSSLEIDNLVFFLLRNTDIISKHLAPKTTTAADSGTSLCPWFYLVV